MHTCMYGVVKAPSCCYHRHGLRVNSISVKLRLPATCSSPPFSEVHTGNDQRYIMPSNMRAPLGISRRKGLQERKQNKKSKLMIR